MTNPECVVIEEASEVQSTTESESVVSDDVSFDMLAENSLTKTLIDTGLIDFALRLLLTLFPLLQPQKDFH